MNDVYSKQFKGDLVVELKLVKDNNVKNWQPYYDASRFIVFIFQYFFWDTLAVCSNSLGYSSCLSSCFTKFLFFISWGIFQSNWTWIFQQQVFFPTSSYVVLKLYHLVQVFNSAKQLSQCWISLQAHLNSF